MSNDGASVIELKERCSVSKPKSSFLIFEEYFQEEEKNSKKASVQCETTAPDPTVTLTRKCILKQRKKTERILFNFKALYEFPKRWEIPVLQQQTQAGKQYSSGKVLK